jgi:uncharacterized protein YcbX
LFGTDRGYPLNISFAIFAATIGLWTWNQHRRGVPYVSKLYISPIKSCKGISVQHAKITKTGFQYDRQYVIIDTNNRFISQRNFPKMALIDISIDEVKNELCLKAPMTTSTAEVREMQSELLGNNCWKGSWSGGAGG